MPMLTALVAAIALGLLVGGRLDGLARYKWRAIVLPFVALALQVVAFLPDESASAQMRLFAAALHVASYVATLTFVYLNRRAPWMWSIGLGVAANALVIVANGGFMPASQAALVGSPHPIAEVGVHNNSVLMSEGTRLAFLADVFRTPDWLPFRRALSVGDLFIMGGTFGLILSLMRRRRAEVAMA